MVKQVYLAGPMEEHSADTMPIWREYAKKYIEGVEDLEALCPTRRLPFHTQFKDVALSSNNRTANICNRIVKQDLCDIDNADLVLADIRRASGRGTGTSMELMYAHLHNKVIILWADSEDTPHPFLEYVCTEKHYDLQEALEALRTYV